MSPEYTNDHYRGLRRYVGKIGMHNHACMVYSNREQQVTAVAEHFSQGFALDQQCTYLADNETAEFVLRALERSGFDIDERLANQSLVILEPHESYLKGGSFVRERMIDLGVEMVRDSFVLGYNGLRFVADMMWALTGKVTSRDLLEHECLANQFFDEYPLSGICHYDANRFNSGLVDLLFATHPSIVKNGAIVENPDFISPDEFLLRMNTIELPALSRNSA